MVYFQWDPQKAIKNFAKHGVSFSEAAKVFFDPKVMLAEDEWHSEKEDRLIALGLSFEKRILFVAFTYRRSGSYEKEIYRIISARIANKDERKTYKQKD
jgi:uncharacterized DUF497 family protein